MLRKNRYRKGHETCKESVDSSHSSTQYSNLMPQACHGSSLSAEYLHYINASVRASKRKVMWIKKNRMNCFDTWKRMTDWVSGNHHCVNLTGMKFHWRVDCQRFLRNGCTNATKNRWYYRIDLHSHFISFADFDGTSMISGLKFCSAKTRVETCIVFAPLPQVWRKSMTTWSLAECQPNQSIGFLLVESHEMEKICILSFH